MEGCKSAFEQWYAVLTLPSAITLYKLNLSNALWHIFYLFRHMRTCYTFKVTASPFGETVYYVYDYYVLKFPHFSLYWTRYSILFLIDWALKIHVTACHTMYDCVCDKTWILKRLKDQTMFFARLLLKAYTPWHNLNLHFPQCTRMHLQWGKEGTSMVLHFKRHYRATPRGKKT